MSLRGGRSPRRSNLLIVGDCFGRTNTALPMTSFIRSKHFRRRVLKFRQRAAEDQLHTAYWAITMLGNNDLSNVLLLAVLFILVGAIDEHHDVAILLKTPTFA